MFKRLIPILSATALMTGAALAQSSTTTTTTTTITDDQAAKVRTYVMKEKRPSAKYEGSFEVGTSLPPTVQFYDFPEDVGVKTYRYGVINDRTVVVDPSTRRIVRIIE